MTNEAEGSKQKDETKKLIAPDGGWAWMVLCGNGLATLFMIPIIQNFGLIYKDQLVELGFTSTDITTLISMNSWFGMILGIFNAPLLKKFGYRKMSGVGVALFTTGTFLTGLANSYLQFMIAYGLVASIGLTYTMSSFSLALNSYFKKRRSYASSRLMTITGLGPIFMPLLISEMLSSYGVRWTVFILAALNLHSFIGVCLLQPIKWHMKVAEEEEKPALEEESSENLLADVHSVFGVESTVGSRKPSVVSRMRTISEGQNSTASSSHPKKTLSLTLLSEQLKVLENEEVSRVSHSMQNLDNEDLGEMSPYKLGAGLASAESLDYHGSNLQHNGRNLNNVLSSQPLLQSDICPDEKAFAAKQEPPVMPEQAEVKRRWWQRLSRYIANMYDLDLFRDPIYCNITVGMSVAIMGELTFSLLTPFILDDMGLSTDEIAIFIAVIAVADLICRFISPYVEKCFKWNSRVMYMLALFLLLVTRLGLFFTSNFTELIIVALGLGIAKGFRTVYWILVIPDYVPLEKLASASAFQNLTTGLFLIVAGPLLGLVVAINNKYSNLIYASNAFTGLTIIMWLTEFAIVRCMNRRRSEKQHQDPASQLSPS